jgi:hypothetical protein
VDPEHLCGAGELDAGGGRYPDAATHDSAFAAVFLQVVFGAGVAAGRAAAIWVSRAGWLPFTVSVRVFFEFGKGRIATAHHLRHPRPATLR